MLLLNHKRSLQSSRHGLEQLQLRHQRQFVKVGCIAVGRTDCRVRQSCPVNISYLHKGVSDVDEADLCEQSHRPKPGWTQNQLYALQTQVRLSVPLTSFTKFRQFIGHGEPTFGLVVRASLATPNRATGIIASPDLVRGRWQSRASAIAQRKI